MRSLPPPRYSRYRTLKRIWRSIINLLSTGYLSDSSVFTTKRTRNQPTSTSDSARAGPIKVITKSKSNNLTKIRKSRITQNPTSRLRFKNKISKLLLNEINDLKIDMIENITTNNSSNNTGLLGVGGGSGNEELIAGLWGWLAMFSAWKKAPIGGGSGNVNFNVTL